MTEPLLPPPEEMYEALVRRDPAYEGLFVAAIRTTGISPSGSLRSPSPPLVGGVLCRPTCPARKPERRNTEFFGSARDALLAGYRACLRCRPLEPAGAAPQWLRDLLAAVEEDPGRRFRDADLRDAGLEPARVRRWFLAHHGMTFHAYQRARRLGRALGRLHLGDDIMETAFDSGFESLSGFHDAVRRLAGGAPGRVRSAAVVHLTRIPTPLGPMVAGATADALCLLEFAERRMLEVQLRRVRKALAAVVVPGETDVTALAARQLELYFEGDLRDFTVPLLTAGTPFQEAVWAELRTIPYAETRSYSEQARRIGRPDAVRAVARANGDNRVAIFVPCHRVVGADGSLTGYGGGLWRKRRLLDLERRHRDAAEVYQTTSTS